MEWPTKKRRAQAPKPKVDPDCQNKLVAVLGFSQARVTQSNDLLSQTKAAKCANPKRRLKRMIRFNNQQRNLQGITKKCDTAEKAVKLALGNLSLNPN